jgi:hypothetical protein
LGREGLFACFVAEEFARQKGRWGPTESRKRQQIGFAGAAQAKLGAALIVAEGQDRPEVDEQEYRQKQIEHWLEIQNIPLI